MTEEQIKAMTDLDIAIANYQSGALSEEELKDQLKKTYQVVFPEATV